MSAYRSFNPRPPRGGRLVGFGALGQQRMFQSAPPAWGATRVARNYVTGGKFQSAPPAWGATGVWRSADSAGRVSIRAPRVGGDAPVTLPPCTRTKFQSAPPAWGATRRAQTHARKPKSFNPRPPRGGRPTGAGDDQQVTPVSIRAPRVGGDNVTFTDDDHKAGFNPRPPRGGRPPFPELSATAIWFQSAPPAWGATYRSMLSQGVAPVSIRAPRVGGDAELVDAPLGVEPVPVSIRAPRVGGDIEEDDTSRVWVVSIRAPRVGGDSSIISCCKRTENSSVSANPSSDHSSAMLLNRKEARKPHGNMNLRSLRTSPEFHDRFGFARCQ